MNWSKPISPYRPHPTRPLSKVRMEKTVVDSLGQLFRYDWKEGHHVFWYVGQLVLEEDLEKYTPITRKAWGI